MTDKKEEFMRPRGCFPDIDLDETWGDQDNLPTGDPIGDIAEPRAAKDVFGNDLYLDTTKKKAGLYPDKFLKEQAQYHKQLRERGMDNADKYFGNSATPKPCCEKPDKYKNIISNALKFYSCKNCGAALGNIND